MQYQQKSKLNEKMRLKLESQRTIEEKLDACQVDLQRVLKMSTPQYLSKIDLEPINSQFLQNNQMFIELKSYLKSWNNKVDVYRKNKQFFKYQNALNTVFIELGIHLREICQTFHRDIQLSYLKNVKKWFEEVYIIFSEEYLANYKKKQPPENPQDILDRIELAMQFLYLKINFYITKINQIKLKILRINPIIDNRELQIKIYFTNYHKCIVLHNEKETKKQQILQANNILFLKQPDIYYIAQPNLLFLLYSNSASKTNDNSKINEIVQRKKLKPQGQGIPISQSLDQFKKFLPRPQTVENQLNFQSSKQVQQVTTQDSRSKNESMQAHNQQNLQQQQQDVPHQKLEFQRNCQTCIPANRSHSYGHIPLQSQVRFISKQLDEKTQFKLEILKQKLSKEQDRKEHQQLAQFVQKWGKERRQLMQFKNSRNELTFQCNEFGKLQYQKKDLQQSLQRSLQSQQAFRKTQDTFFPDAVLTQQIPEYNPELFQNFSFLSPMKAIGDTAQVNEFQFQTRNTAMQSTENVSQLMQISTKQESNNVKKQQQQNLDDSELDQKIQKNLFNNDSDDEGDTEDNKSYSNRQKSKSRDITEELASQIQIYSYINNQTLEEKTKIGDNYKKFESFESYNPQDERTKNPSFSMYKSQNDNNDNEDSPSKDIFKQQQANTQTPQMQKNKSYFDGSNPQVQNSQFFKTTSSFFPNNNQLPTMETFNQIHSRQSSSHHKSRTNQMSETLQNFQKQKTQQESLVPQSSQKIQTMPYKQPINVDLFGLMEQKSPQLYDNNQGFNHLNIQHQVTQEIKRNKINQLIQTKGKIINLSQKEFPIVSQKRNNDNELTEELIKERLANSIMQYSTKIKSYQDSRKQINTKNKQSITDKQVINDQIDEISKIRNIFSKKNIKINASNLKSSLLTTILPTPKYKDLKKKKSFLPEQGAHLLSMEEY